MVVEEIKARIVKIKEEGKTAKVEDKPALVKELASLETELAEAQSKPKVKAKVKPKVKTEGKAQGIKDFATEFVKAKGTGLTLQGKAQRRIKGLTKALITRKWAVDKKDNLIFTKEVKGRKFTVTMDKSGQNAALVTLGKCVSFPLGKGAFKSVDYVLTAYGYKYLSASQVYEEVESVV